MGASRVAAALGSRRSGLLVDFDGTISPIASSPEAATIDPICRLMLRELSRVLPLVAVVSGRPVGDLRRGVGLDGLTYVGSHGLEWWPPWGNRLTPPIPWPTAEEVAALASWLATRIARSWSLEGIRFEQKPGGLAIHFRQAREPVRAGWAILRAVSRPDLIARGFRPLWGKRVLELRPRNAPTKGSALEALVDRLGLGAVAYLGDDRTDVDAFRAVHRLRAERGIPAFAIGVDGPETPAMVRRWADLTLEGVASVARFLTLLAQEAAHQWPRRA